MFLNCNIGKATIIVLQVISANTDTQAFARLRASAILRNNRGHASPESYNQAQLVATTCNCTRTSYSIRACNYKATSHSVRNLRLAQGPVTLESSLASSYAAYAEAEKQRPVSRTREHNEKGPTAKASTEAARSGSHQERGLREKDLSNTGHWLGQLQRSS